MSNLQRKKLSRYKAKFICPIRLNFTARSGNKNGRNFPRYFNWMWRQHCRCIFAGTRVSRRTVNPTCFVLSTCKRNYTARYISQVGLPTSALLSQCKFPAPTIAVPSAHPVQASDDKNSGIRDGNGEPALGTSVCQPSERRKGALSGFLPTTRSI